MIAALIGFLLAHAPGGGQGGFQAGAAAGVVLEHHPRPGPVATELAGNPLAAPPHFEHVRAFLPGAPVHAAFDARELPELAGTRADLYVAAHRPPDDWAASPALIDVRGAPVSVTISAGGIEANTFALDEGTLSCEDGLSLGRGYDVVLDHDQDGVLGPGDLIDGLGKVAGFYVVARTELAGPLPVREVLYSGGSWLSQDLYYPADIAVRGELPLVVVSHGNGHNYTWYDHIGVHLASHGFVVMSHSNQTGPGIETASTTTLTNTDYILENQGTIDGGALAGHLDGHKIVWIGHSRGGEGVVRAYDRIFDGEYTPKNFSLSDIVLVSSIAPTDFLGPDGADPHDANYHLWVGGADRDVSGCAGCEICQSFHLLERATGNRQSISLHGAGHGAFHAGTGLLFGVGQCLLTREETHVIMRGYLLPLVRAYVFGDPPAYDFLWRQWESFQPIGAPTNPCTSVDLMYKLANVAQKRVIDDFESAAAPDRASSGGRVRYDVLDLFEGRLDDADLDFTSHSGDPMNGMTVAGIGDTSSGVVFEWKESDRFVEFEVLPELGDLRAYTYLSFRACQTTRHPSTTFERADLTFSVELADRTGAASILGIGAWGGGIEEPFQRNGCGLGTGWGNEFETVRIRLADFTRGAAGVDLANVAAITFRFGPTFGASLGRIGLDDVELVKD